MSDERQIDQLERVRGLVIGVNEQLIIGKADRALINALDEVIALIQDVQGRGDGEMEFYATSLVSIKTMKPMVDIKLGATRVQLTPDKAREVASYIFQVAGAADFDAQLVGMLQNDMGLKVLQAGEFIQRLRNFRAGVENPK